jgi:succinoglycan biosynthesis protein ExoL
MQVSYFTQELGDPAVEKRLRMLRLGGRKATLLGFERDRPPPTLIGTPIFSLGNTQDGRFGQRILALIAALPRTLWLHKHWAEADVILARNLEMLWVACTASKLTGFKGRIVYECLDIHRLLLRQDNVGKMLRGIERECLKRVSFIITSSPAFVENYFTPVQGYTGPVKLVENKIFDASLDHPGRQQQVTSKAPKTAAAPWRIVWAGVLRCEKTLQTLTDVAARSEGRVEIDIWGTPALDQIPDFHDRVSNAPHVKYRGAYTRKDLPRLYGDAHFVWTGDYFEQGGNSDWLLPNRLYEGLFHGAIPIAAKASQTAKWLAERGVGAVIDEPIEQSLFDFTQKLDETRFRALEAQIAGLDPGLLAFTREDCLTLLKQP